MQWIISRLLDVCGWVSLVIGLTGMQGDIVGWVAWLEALEPYADSPWARLLLIVFGVLVIGHRTIQHFSDGGFVRLPDAANLINRTSFGAENYSIRHAIAAASNRRNNTPMSEWYRQDLVQDFRNGKFRLYSKLENENVWSPITFYDLSPFSKRWHMVAMRKRDFYWYMLKLRIFLFGKWIRAKWKRVLG